MNSQPRKRLTATVVALGMQLLVAAGAQAQSDPEYAVRLVSGHSIGTAVLVERGRGETTEHWLLTAYHNIQPGELLTVESLHGESTAVEELTDAPMYLLRTLDVVAIKITTTGYKWLVDRQVGIARLSRDPPNTGGGIFTLGQPTLSILGRPYRPYNYRSDGGIGKRQVAQRFLPAEFVGARLRRQELLLLNDFTITYGFSGGPVFAKWDATHALVGLIQGGDPAERRIAWATPADEIEKALRNLSSAESLGRADSMEAGQQWPIPEFRSHVYGRAFHDALIRVDRVTPDPLVFGRGLSTSVEVRVLIAGGHARGVRTAGEESGADHLVLDPEVPNGVIHETGLESVDRRNGFINFKYAFRVTSAFVGKRVRFPLVLKGAGPRELGRVEIDGAVVSDDRFEYALGAGFGHVFGGSFAVSRIVLNLAPEWNLLPPMTTLALRVGGGLSVLVGEGLTFFGPTQKVLDTDSFTSGGASVELMPELRFWRDRLVGLRLAAGVQLDVFAFDKYSYRVAVPLQLAVALQINDHSLVPRVQIAYESSPGVNWVREDDLARHRLPQAGHISAGIEVSYIKGL